MTADKSGYEKMLSGEPYLNPDWDLIGRQVAARELLDRLNATPMREMDQRRALMAELFGSVHPEAMILSPINLEYGKHIHLGGCFINFDCIFLDGAEIRIGNNTLVGPRVQFITSTHPVRNEDRTWIDPATGQQAGGWGINKPITVGDNCWIGAGAIILPGVSIGEGSTIGAGSVVAKSIPARSLAVGNPCRVIKSLA